MSVKTLQMHDNIYSFLAWALALYMTLSFYLCFCVCSHFFSLKLSDNFNWLILLSPNHCGPESVHIYIENTFDTNVIIAKLS